jgi:bifunctional oligoribonuclease and PAP phosphatase NrnA
MIIADDLKLEFQRAKKVFEAAERIVIISHRSPDGDAVGSNLALRHGLEALGKTVVSACVDPVPANSMFLKKADTFVLDFNYDDFDVVVSVDCGALKLVKFHEEKPEILSGEKPFVNFDHHESNGNFGTVNPVDPDACATAYVLYGFFKFMGWKINIDAASALLHGVYFDTGGMMHSNATAEVFRVASDLMSKGANVQKISKELFHTTPVNKLRLWGKILERTYVNDEGVTVSAVGRVDYESTGATSKDTGGAIDYLNAVPGSKYCVLLSENDEGLVKGSLRTQRDDVNLSDVASQWGGGGHPKASGFGIRGELKPVMSWKIMPPEGGDEHGVDLKF